MKNLIIQNLGKEYENLHKEASKEMYSFLIKGEQDIKRLKLKKEESVFIGSIELCEKYKDIFTCYSTFDNYKCSNYYHHYGEYMFNSKYCMMNFKDIDRQKWWIWGNFGKDCEVFIRPDSGKKDFPAMVVDIENIGNINEYGMALISSPKKIHGEWRFLIKKDYGIVAESCYWFFNMRCNVPSAPVKAIEFVNDVLKNVKYSPDDFYYMDICDIGNGMEEYKIVEINGFSSGSLYSCDKKKIVDALKD